MLLIDQERSGDIVISQFKEAFLEDEVVESTGNSVSVLFIDVETTGVSFENDRVIQLACRPVLFDSSTGRPTRLMNSRTFYNDPGKEISEEITALTGVTNEDVRGKSIDWAWVSKIISKVDFVVAHNARFDRHFIKKHMIESDLVMPETIWACSMQQVNWRKIGCTAGRSLETLSAWHGFYYGAHDAAVDVDAMIYLLLKSNTVNTLLDTAKKSQWRVFAVKFPRGKNDEIKCRGYRWDPDVMSWWCGFEVHEEAIAESEWLVNNFSIEPQLFELKPNHLFD